MMSNHHALYDLGYTRTTMAVNRGKQIREEEQTPKNGLSSDCRLQLACMKLELLVIVDQHATVNTFPGLVHTARHTMRVGKMCIRDRHMPCGCGWRLSLLPWVFMAQS